MPRVPLAEFEPALSKKLEELWGTPPNLYRALGNQPRLVAAWAEFSRVLRHEARTPRSPGGARRRSSTRARRRRSRWPRP